MPCSFYSSQHRSGLLSGFEAGSTLDVYLLSNKTAPPMATYDHPQMVVTRLRAYLPRAPGPSIYRCLRICLTVAQDLLRQQA